MGWLGKPCAAAREARPNVAKAARVDRRVSMAGTRKLYAGVGVVSKMWAGAKQACRVNECVVRHRPAEQRALRHVESKIADGQKVLRRPHPLGDAAGMAAVAYVHDSAADFLFEPVGRTT